MATPYTEELEGLSRSEVLRASPRMFESNLLDKLSRVHPIVPPALFIPAIVVLLVEGVSHGAGWFTPLWMSGGYLFWTLTEYWLHRLVFHFEPEEGIGALYARGQGVPMDYGEAIKWFRRAAAQGNADAANWLGNFYANGLGVAKDPAALHFNPNVDSKPDPQK